MTAQIQLTRGLVALVDDEDAEWLSARKWCASPDARNTITYAATSVKRDGRWTSVKMHRLIMEPSPGFLVDHRDGDGLNNQRSNLRICTHVENLRNSRRLIKSGTGFKGVYRTPNGKRFTASLRFNGEYRYLGSFDTAEQAHAAYCEAASRLFGEFARAA